MENWSTVIFSAERPFEEKVQQIFEYQVENNLVYRRFCEALAPDILNSGGKDISRIPLLPVKAFKDAEITAKPDEQPDRLFKSSGTSEMQRSIHRVHEARIYEQSLVEGFKAFYNLDQCVIWAYTPGYADNPHSSLIYMLQKLIDQDESGKSRFLPLANPLESSAIEEVEREGKQLILFGAAFGLLDLVELGAVRLPSNAIVIETGGMKTHRREMSRRELHRRLARGFGLDGSRIHSEYGMAELLSQAYAIGGNWFRTVPWMKVSIRNPEDPSETVPPNNEGLIGVIDLANVHSCPFLLTGDTGVMDERGRFEVRGRWNPKDLRGCNFLIDED
ncbi:hypothetical protein [Fodinibius sediminis]|uniref:Acyl-protein synthetase, LuxE n=1 Tax=Fodinibius sediminis TaxID=1214077 RepID=A0A521EML5_9BACT|nr:hypothetical protein [Fodinibius sediminis]SMO85167.1 Acyl-protein synthetase, LuxE [Fodinibius sediminis]